MVTYGLKIYIQRSKKGKGTALRDLSMIIIIPLFIGIKQTNLTANSLNTSKDKKNVGEYTMRVIMLVHGKAMTWNINTVKVDIACLNKYLNY